MVNKTVEYVTSVMSNSFVEPHLWQSARNMPRLTTTI